MSDSAPTVSAIPRRDHSPLRSPWLVSAALAGVLVALLVYELMPFRRGALQEATGWSVLFLAACWGYGAELARFCRTRAPGLGLAIVWGASVICAIGGVLTLFRLMNRAGAFLVVEVGTGLALYALFRLRRELSTMFRAYARLSRSQTALAVTVLFVIGLVVLRVLGSIADRHTNPYDDDIAYLGFVSKLSGTGTFIEPFSFRRLSAFGGQTLYLSLLWPRVGAQESNGFDRGLCFALVLLVTAGMRHRSRRLPLTWIIGASAFFICMPSKSINTASYYSGTLFFLALYRTLAEVDRRQPSLRRWLPAALVAAATCTLRQNYLPAAGGLALVMSVVVARSGKGDERLPWRDTVTEVAPLFVYLGLALAPWLVVSWLSNQTFLFPVMKGTFNTHLATEASDNTFFRQLRLQIWVLFDAGALRLLPGVAFAALLFARGERRTFGLTMGVVSLLSAVVVVKGFSLSDAGNIARYTFGYWSAFVLVVIAEIGLLRRASPESTRMPVIALIGGLALQMPFDKLEVHAPFMKNALDIDAKLRGPAEGESTGTAEAARYRRLQNAIPQGATMAALLDDTYYLDFSRNTIFNLDMPGYSSAKPGYPFFRGAPAARDYFVGIGIRYLAFVRGDSSRYHYRREFWVEKLVSEEEIWRDFSPYLLSVIDTFAEFSTSYPVLFEERGMVVVDLEGTKR